MNIGRIISLGVALMIAIVASGTAAGGEGAKRHRAKAQRRGTIWTVTIDATGPAPTISYKLGATPSNAPNCSGPNPNPPPSADYLYICPGDTVKWVAKTNPNQTGQMRNELGVLHEDRVLLDKHRNSHQGFHASNGGLTEGGDADSGVVHAVEHKYYVVVFDKETKAWHYADPKIIVGKGSPVKPPAGE